MTKELLLDKGFKFKEYPDTNCYFIEEHAGEKANYIASICGMNINASVNDDVCDVMVLQCNEDFSKPCFYCDGDVWDLSEEEFKIIVNKL